MKVLHIIPYYHFVPPNNGGALRCYHLAKELSTQVDLTVFTFQDIKSIKDDSLKNIKILNPKSELKSKIFFSKIINAIKFRFWMRSVKGPAEAIVLQAYPVLKKLLKKEQYDLIIFEHLTSLLLGKITKRLSPNTIRIVDQHNVDHILYKQNNDLSVKPNYIKYQYLKKLEINLSDWCDAYFACSKYDLETFDKINRIPLKGFVVPNGTELHHTELNDKDFTNPSLLFCGSLNYPPNKNGLLWFYKNVWPKVKENVKNITLTVIGRNGTDEVYNPLKEDDQIDFIGEVDQVEPYYRKCNIALAPLFEGSGTRLKILEAMSYGNPVLSTALGAQGIDYTHKKDILIADDDEQFIEMIHNAYNRTINLKSIAFNAHKLVESKYDWKIIGQNANDYLNTLIKPLR